MQDLAQRIDSEVRKMEDKVLNFENDYNKFVRPLLASSCLILPHGLGHPSTLFLHKQTFEILDHNPSYLSCFDLMSYKSGVRDAEEWYFFMDHLVKKKIYIVEVWNLTLSTVETLMYDHGIVGPDDGTDAEFYKGECDASFEKGRANLSFIIWKGDKIIHSEVIKGIRCKNATEAEAYAAFALLFKASELNIQKLLVCSDCKAVCSILSGEMEIGSNHLHRNLYLTLRSMKRLFKKLIVSWKPREVNSFADDLTKASDVSLASVVFPTIIMRRWAHHLKGLPLFRIERTSKTKAFIKKFGMVDNLFFESLSRICGIRY